MVDTAENLPGTQNFTLCSTFSTMVKQLQALGIEAASIRFDNLTLESDRYVCVRESNEGKSTVVIVDTTGIKNTMRRTITADSAALHPAGKILALRGTAFFFVFWCVMTK